MPMRPLTTATLVAALLAPAIAPRDARAQHEGHATGESIVDSARAPRWHVMAQAIPVVTRAANTIGGADLTEGYVSQAAAMARGDMLSGHLRMEATLNAEGLTMERGELSTGAFGEGYVDRRHPHTYLHELVVTGIGSFGPLAYSASAGRGFAPFGTDDPMMRPFEKYPINHHLAQILERALVMGAVRLGPAMLEGATFGGEEPTSPRSLPRASRIGDSWSVRGTVLPIEGVELQASYARVTSPEQPSGFGLDQRKQSVSGRLVSSTGSRYLLAEWARTDEWDQNRDVQVFGYESALVEGAVSLGPLGLALRLEQTARPEEERLEDPFRTPRPAPDLAISGITRWRTATVAVILPSATLGPIRGYPFVEIERLAAKPQNPTSVFRPSQFYSTDTPWMASVGVRLRYGPMHARMGRYGAALPSGPPLRALGVSRHDAAAHEDH
jgi:hypothetical protein